jgi:hypothetical protein
MVDVGMQGPLSLTISVQLTTAVVRGITTGRRYTIVTFHGED